MNRIIICVAVALAAIAPARSALADDPPTAEQLAQAKQAYEDGKALHDQGKLLDAVEKFKTSYKLSRNPLLLYNIGLTLDEAGQKDNALLYYRQFLSDAPADAAQRATATARVKVLEKEKLDADLNGTPAKPEGTTPTPPTPTQPKPGKIKPPGTYGASDFQHQAVDSAPPGKPLDVTAFVPEDSGFTVTLFYRGQGDSTFTAKPMKWRYKELVARIPAKKMTGSSIQYYLEVTDQAGEVITRSGKPADPNLISIEAGATPHFYMDMTDDGDQVPASEVRHEDEEDPLQQHGHAETHTAQLEDQPPVPEQPTAIGQGFTDVGSQKFKYAKWGTTGGAAVLLGAAMTTYILAGSQATSLVNDSKSCGPPPCRMYDHTYDQAWQDAGKRYQTISNITFGVGIATAAVAGYFWYRELTAKKHGELKASATSSSPDATWIVAPAVGAGFAGAAASARF